MNIGDASKTPVNLISKDIAILVGAPKRTLGAGVNDCMYEEPIPPTSWVVWPNSEDPGATPITANPT